MRGAMAGLGIWMLAALGQGDDVPSGWVTVAEETFEHVDFGEPGWRVDEVPDDGPFADAGRFFRDRGITPPPEAFRATAPFGQGGWLTAESYTRSSGASWTDFVAVVSDPARPDNRVLRIASPAHTDATVIRVSSPLPPTYRLSLRVGFPRFGDGLPGLNGYDDEEKGEPWRPDDARKQNGFYWLTILDALPRPHNSVWIHHHRKVVIDSDNHFPPWMEVFDGEGFRPSGEHPVMMFAIDGRGEGSEMSGKPFLSFSAGGWQHPGAIRAVDAYLPDEWYDVSITRVGDVWTLEVSGRFRYGGRTTCRASIDARQACVWHFNRPGEDAGDCVDTRSFASLGPEAPFWPPGEGWPDYFMFGDPHSNYYEGEVLYDDVRLEVPAHPFGPSQLGE